MENKNKAYLAAIVYACTIGFSFVFIKIALQSAAPLDVLAHRFLVAFIAALIPLLVRKAKVEASAKEMLSIVPLAIFYPVLFFLLQTFGLVYIPSAEAGIIQATVPIFTVILAFLIIKEKTNWKQILFVLLSVGGVLFVSVMKGVDAGAYDFRGTFLILGATLSLALYSVFARKLTKKFTVYTLTVVMSLIGFLLFNAIALGSHVSSGTITEFFAPFQTPSYVLAIVFLGAVSSFLSAFLSNYALSSLQASKMSVFANLATVIALFAGTIFLGETMHWYYILGAIVIVAGVLGTNKFGSK